MDVREGKLRSIIEEGKTRVPHVLGEIQREFQDRKDTIVKPDSIIYHTRPYNGRRSSFDHTPINDIGVELFKRGVGSMSELTLTNFSKNQLLSKLGIPVSYADRLMKLGENELLIDNLNKMTERRCENGMLIRHIDGVAKGILSPSYRMMDASIVFEGFVKACLESGYVPYGGGITESRYHLSFIQTEVFNPTPNEYIVFGLIVKTSDYGASALIVEQVILRITCQNLMTGMRIQNQVHLGKRFTSNESFVQISSETHMLDSKATASAIRDAVKSSYQLHEGLKETIENSIDKDVNINTEVEKMKKKGFSKEFADKVKNTYEMDIPVELLPKEESAWRLSNTISLLANSKDISPDLSLDAQKYAMGTL
jgi:hypothetical protein|tara:strand:+ start:307 stop:1410 length:1104 start_codon:yes stop_codon:yes gene_type:complete